MLLSVELNWIEIAVLFFASTVFGLAVHFFLNTRKSLKKFIPEKKKVKKVAEVTLQNKQEELSFLQQRIQKLKHRSHLQEQDETETTIPAKEDYSKDQLVASLKQTVAQQQTLLNGFLRQVEEMEDNGKEELKLENEDLRSEITKLEKLIDKKDEDLGHLKQQVATAQSMTARIDEICSEFDLLQARMRELEVEAKKVNSLEMELEEAQGAYETLRKDLLKKQEKLEHIVAENGELRNQLHELEDKLSEANRQRQQFQKKVQFLQDLNNDLNTMTESNKKLQTELRRIGELESMLNMIADERDQLLKKQYK